MPPRRRSRDVPPVDPPPRRRTRDVPPVDPPAFATTPNGSNGTPSPCVQGHHSTESPIPCSTPSTAQSRTHTSTQSSVDPTAVEDTPDETILTGMYVIIVMTFLLIFAMHQHKHGRKYPSGPTKKRRGISRGVASQKIMDATKQKLVVQAREGELRTFGATSSPFANEIGIIMRNVVSQRLIGWGDAKEHDRALAYNRLLVSKL